MLCTSAYRGEWLGREGQVHHHQPEVRAPHQFGEVRIPSDPGGVLEPLRDRHLEQGRCAVLVFPLLLRIASSRGAAGEQTGGIDERPGHFAGGAGETAGGAGRFRCCLGRPVPVATGEPESGDVGPEHGDHPQRLDVAGGEAQAGPAELEGTVEEPLGLVQLEGAHVGSGPGCPSAIARSCLPVRTSAAGAGAASRTSRARR